MWIVDCTSYGFLVLVRPFHLPEDATWYGFILKSQDEQKTLSLVIELTIDHALAT
jgi:hypothetical protein